MTTGPQPGLPPQAMKAMQDGLRLHQQGRLAEAASLYAGVARSHPRFFDAHYLLGTAKAQLGDGAAALVHFDQAILLNPRAFFVHLNLGVTLQQLNRLDEAIAAFDKAIAIEPGNAEAHFNKANVLAQQKRHADATASYGRALTINPKLAPAYNNRGLALRALGRTQDALADFEQASKLAPDLVDALNNQGVTLLDLGRAPEAIAIFDRILARMPSRADTLGNRGNALLQTGRLDEALRSFEAAVAAAPGDARLRNNHGNGLRAAHALDAAMAQYRQAIGLMPGLAEAHYNLGLTLHEAGQTAAALQAYEQALKLDPDNAECHFSLGAALRDLKRLDAALDSYRLAGSIEPHLPLLAGTILFTRQSMCDWEGLDAEIAALTAAAEAGRNAALPFNVIAAIDTPTTQLEIASTYIAAFARKTGIVPTAALPWRGKDRVVVGYYSADYQDHATCELAAGLFEAHDRAQFEIVGLSFGPSSDDVMRRRVSAAFNRFIDVRNMSDAAVAAMSREIGIDIAVDMKGYTRDSRPGLFLHRCAPIQVGFLGYPGTAGRNSNIDYIIADRIVVPRAHDAFYSEAVVRMPGCYQPNDPTRTIAAGATTRRDAGLPEGAFVLAGFNNTYKITPQMFDVWMRLLGEVDDAVLWLLQDNAFASDNLRREASRRGIDPARLIFAERVDRARHLARQRLADLFVDTTPCCAHTTASDAVLAGLPVLTIPGQSFASRVAASILHTLGLDELVSSSLAAYQEKAIALARDRAALTALRQRLDQAVRDRPLYDIRTYTKHLERAYIEMVSRAQRGSAPSSFDVADVNASGEA